ncbi:MAG: hypothetical protein IPK67_16495 [Planctomycetes bacterium]|nr:hypothetical protein [Planctomycetota bacterium]
MLVSLATDDPDFSVRQVAVRKVDDQATLVRVATTDPIDNIREEVVPRLQDQTVIAEIAVRGRSDNARNAAVLLLTDQSLLAKIAIEDQSAMVRDTAVEHLTDQACLEKVASSAKSLRLRITAISKVTRPDALCRWATEPQAAIRQAAVKGIRDDAWLLKRLTLEPSSAVREEIVDTVSRAESLVEVGTTADSEFDRLRALTRLREAVLDAAQTVELAHKAIAAQVAALATQPDGENVLPLALEGKFDVVRAAAARRITTPALLESLGAQTRDRAVLAIVLTRMDDPAALNRLSTSAADRAMRIAADRKSGQQTWEEIFHAATVGGSDESALGDALAAVALFAEKQADATVGVVQACLNLIRRGNESRIPEMVDLLEIYGDQSLAEDYLNCGQPDLYGAGVAWAHKRGFDVGQGNGSNRAAWGSNR